MDERLFTLIMCHLATVGGSVRLLIDSGISLPTSVAEWMSDPDARTGTLKYGCHFRKHDFGCSIHCPDSVREAVIQFGPRGETFGFTREHILALVQALAPKPLNVVISWPADFTMADLAAWGVRRVSVGGGLARAAWAGLVRAAQPLAGALLFISHRFDEVFSLCDRVVVLKEGRIVFDGPFDAVQKTEHYQRIFRTDVEGE